MYLAARCFKVRRYVVAIVNVFKLQGYKNRASASWPFCKEDPGKLAALDERCHRTDISKAAAV